MSKPLPNIELKLGRDILYIEGDIITLTTNYISNVSNLLDKLLELKEGECLLNSLDRYYLYIKEDKIMINYIEITKNYPDIEKEKNITNFIQLQHFATYLNFKKVKKEDIRLHVLF